MVGFKELKDKLKTDEKLKMKFSGIKSAQEAVDLARELGFNINLNDIENDIELSEDILEAIAGGKGSTKKQNNTFYHVEVSGYDLVIDKKTGEIISSKRNNYKG